MCVTVLYTLISIYVFLFLNFLGPHNSIWSLALFGTKSQGPQKKLTNIILVVAFFAASIGIAF